MAELPPELDSAFANGLISHYGSEWKAAAAVGVSRSAIHHASTGEHHFSPKNRGILERLGGGAFNAVERAAGLIQSQAGLSPSAQHAQAKTMAAAERRAPGATRADAEAYARHMERFRLDPFGNPLDALNRRITPDQERALAVLLSGYRAGTLDRAKYHRLVAYQLGYGDQGGYRDVSEDIAPL